MASTTYLLFIHASLPPAAPFALKPGSGRDCICNTWLYYSPYIKIIIHYPYWDLLHYCEYNTHLTVKPIFHQNAKSFALGTFASPNAKHSTFALPNGRNTNMLVSFALGDANFLRWPCTFNFFCVYFIGVG